MKIFLTPFVFSMLVFCSFSQTNEVMIKKPQTLKTSLQIGYLFFTVKKKSSGKEEITLQDKKITEGILKSKSFYNINSGVPGDLIVILEDRNGKEIDKQIIENPLRPEMEIFGTEMSRKKVELQNAEFTVRYSFTAEITTVKIEKITSAGNQVIFNHSL